NPLSLRAPARPPLRARAGAHPVGRRPPRTRPGRTSSPIHCRALTVSSHATHRVRGMPAHSPVQFRRSGPALVALPAPVALQTRPVVFIGVDGLAWADITEDTPALASLTAQAVGSLVVRSVNTATCPADGWLALNTGSRAADTASPCRILKSPKSGDVPAWDA